ncbi:MAG TPA: UDP-2,3-diacylglucosamine diphosphatase [Syntrophorhabdus sp.]|jgi:UDP-2,3-diacylglucosamine hydrolase|nr:UDP-2,3-diacylglucosamine diphosphatase [Syntrophorhabdus sp.]MDI9558881.1 UDP-2,3-diacylglucosamine diphosphatase [Pseudomonadota bacterium]OPX95647.1 MAG: UDP-2,3-diacylglucosamine hydrolase [Syntrophorhabdus sp. PtaB.Bin027]OQB74282.1 MAG: UDP-2,3-diacylglucosamine hydrolase [Deltaproteobacteria bacterium ADurb.Bin135]MBP8743787.1 UDP-2,3-diacylglucosamine diphosphatase [Syntrophorhabdus sp.]
MKMIFFADTHLTKKNKKKLRMVEIFIRNVCIDADMVFVLGDLFEFYHGYEGYIYPWYRPIVDAFKTITEQGKSVYFLEGNHEFDMGPFFESYTGIQCVKNLTIDIEGKRTFISHGDEFYLNLVTRALKAPLTIGAMNLFGPRLSWKIAMAVSRIMSKKKKGQNPKVKNVFREYAREKLKEGYDAVILAHTHIADYMEFGAGMAKKVYLNTGDFIRKSTYIEYTSEEGFQLKEYKPLIRGI